MKDRSSAEKEGENEFLPLNPTSEADERYCANVRNHKKKAVIFAMQALYQVDICKIPAKDAVQDVLQYEKTPWAVEFIKKSVFSVCEDLPEIDSVLSNHITCNWTLERLASVERNLLRLGAFLVKDDKMLPCDKAVDLICSVARDYATDRSANLIKGILSSVKSDYKSGKISKEAQSTVASETLSDCEPVKEQNNG